MSAGTVHSGEDSRGFCEWVKIPSGGNKGDRARLFSVVPHGETRGIGYTLKYEVAFTYEKTLVFSESAQMLAQVAHRGCVVSIRGDSEASSG